MLKNILPALAATVLLAGCLKNSQVEFTCNANYDPCAIKAPQSEIQSVQHYLDSMGITGTTQHCSGMFYIIDTMGTGATPTICSTTSVSYVGKLVNGTVFDTTANGPITFPLSNTITGWVDGMLQIKAGSTIRMFVPPSLGYGSAPRGSIPANSILVFKTKLIAVN